MSSAQRLREFIQQRLTAAAEEIFTEFGKTIVRYEEEIDRQRRLLDISCKPETELHTTDCPQQDVCKEEEEVLPDQQLHNQETNSSLDQEEAKPPQIKEEHEELCLSQEGEQLPLKEETHTFMVIATYEESEAEPNRDQLLSHSSPVAENQEQEGSKNVDSRSTRKKRCNHSNSPEESSLSKRQSTTDASKKALKWDVCGKKKLLMSFRKPHACETCGKSFFQRDTLTVHMRTHTGERPYCCETCGKCFTQRSTLTVHMRTHTGERPYPCETCGKTFMRHYHLLEHIRTHTGEKPNRCNTCGKMFTSRSGLLKHLKTHTGEKPYPCKTCGKMFSRNHDLFRHVKSHTGEKPYLCKTCGKAFTSNSHMWRHIRTHAYDSDT